MSNNLKHEMEQREIYDSILEDVKMVEDILEAEIIDNDIKVEQKQRFANFDEIKERADSDANLTLHSMINFFVDKKYLNHENSQIFIEQKMKNDQLTLSNLIYQMITAEYAITKLLESIDNGNGHPRQFEVLSSLQKSKMEIIKHKAFVEIQLENNYKLLNKELEKIYIESGEDDPKNAYRLPEGKKSFQAGSKSLLKRLKQQNGPEKFNNLESITDKKNVIDDNE